MTDTILVSFDSSHGDVSVLIVGRKTDKTLEIINAFQGQEAEDLYQKLTTVKEKDNEISSD